MNSPVNDGSSIAAPVKSRVAVIGANGRLGNALMAGLADQAELIPLTRAEVDLADPSGIGEILSAKRVDLVIITAAMTAVDYCENHQDEAYAVNAEGPGEIARACAARGVRVVYFSTDFVFDGEKDGSYAEDEATSPISVYGASKLAGEEQVMAACGENLVVRVSWLYGAASPAFPEWIIRQAMANEVLSLPAEKTGSPTSSEDVARYLPALLPLDGRKGASGIVHLCNSGSCSWQEWGQFCVETALEAGLDLKAKRIGANSLQDIKAFVAARPPRTVLDNGRYSRLTGVAPRDWKSALRDHLLASELLGAAGAQA